MRLFNCDWPKDSCSSFSLDGFSPGGIDIFTPSPLFLETRQTGKVEEYRSNNNPRNRPLCYLSVLVLILFEGDAPQLAILSSLPSALFLQHNGGTLKSYRCIVYFVFWSQTVFLKLKILSYLEKRFFKWNLVDISSSNKLTDQT